MTDTNTPKRAWTPAPWLYRPKSGSWHTAPPENTKYSYGNAFIRTPDSCDMEFANDADAALIALAPSMAEAILGMEGAILNHPHPDGPEDATDKMLIVAEELRAIGTTND